MQPWVKHMNTSSLVISKELKISVEEQLSCGCTSMSRNYENVENVHQAGLADLCWNINKISEITGVSLCSCQCILKEDLMIKWVTAKFVLRLFIGKQKNKRVNICCDLQEKLRKDRQFLT
jgi:hypothetical protein